MTTAFTNAAGLLAQESTTDVDIVCDNQGALCDALYNLTDNEVLAEASTFFLSLPLKIVLIVALALVVNRLIRRGIKSLTARLGRVTAQHGEAVVTARSVERAEERASTVGSLLRSLSTAVVYGIALVMLLEALGVSIVPIIASAGVLGLAIGFGAQSIVEDMLRGVFMLSEDQFGVGDRIDVGTVNGYVERVTLRTVVIRDPQGTLWHIPNSEIDSVANEAQLSSRATVEIGVGYDVDLSKAFDVLQTAAQDAADEPAWSDSVQGAPEVSGVQELGDDQVGIRVIVWVAAGERRKFERYLRRSLKEALDGAQIAAPNRQVDIWLRDQKLVTQPA